MICTSRKVTSLFLLTFSFGFCVLNQSNVLAREEIRCDFPATETDPVFCVGRAQICHNGPQVYPGQPETEFGDNCMNFFMAQCYGSSGYNGALALASYGDALALQGLTTIENFNPPSIILEKNQFSGNHRYPIKATLTQGDRRQYIGGCLQYISTPPALN